MSLLQVPTYILSHSTPTLDFLLHAPISRDPVTAASSLSPSIFSHLLTEFANVLSKSALLTRNIPANRVHCRTSPFTLLLEIYVRRPMERLLNDILDPATQTTDVRLVMDSGSTERSAKVTSATHLATGWQKRSTKIQ